MFTADQWNQIWLDVDKAEKLLTRNSNASRKLRPRHMDSKRQNFMAMYRRLRREKKLAASK
jgi:hypothetical protein